MPMKTRASFAGTHKYRRLGLIIFKGLSLAVCFSLLYISHQLTSAAGTLQVAERLEVPLNLGCHCNPTRTSRNRLGVAVVVRNEALRLPNVVQKILARDAVWKLYIVDQNSTDQSVKVVRDLQSNHGERLSWIESDDVGYNELSSPLIYSLLARDGVDWFLTQDADEDLSELFLDNLDNLMGATNLDGYRLLRCNSHGREVTKELKVRMWRIGRALPNVGFGTQAIPVCGRCWKSFLPEQCSIYHNKTNRELSSDEERYKNICVNKCSRASDQNVAFREFPDCFHFRECASIFNFSRPQQKMPTQLMELKTANTKCYSNFRMLSDEGAPYVERVKEVLSGGLRFLDGWEGRMIFVLNTGRSGSKFFAQYGSEHCSRGVYIHEEPPTMDVSCGGLQYFPKEASYESRLIKAASIEALVLERGANLYVETNPNFKASFYDVIFREFSHVDLTVVILRREPHKVIKSLMDIGWFGAKNMYDGPSHDYASSVGWMQTTASPNSFIFSKAAERAAGADPLLLISNYIVNVEATALGIQRLHTKSNITFVEASAENLFSDPFSVFKKLHIVCRANIAFGTKVTDHFKATVTEAELKQSEKSHVDEYIKTFFAPLHLIHGTVKGNTLPQKKKTFDTASPDFLSLNSEQLRSLNKSDTQLLYSKVLKLLLLMNEAKLLPLDMDFGRVRGGLAIGRGFLDAFSQEVIKHAKPNSTCLEFQKAYLGTSLLKTVCAQIYELSYDQAKCNDTGIYQESLGYCGDVHRLDEVIPPEKFDIIICTQVFEHLQKPWEAVTQLSKVMKQDALMMFSAPQTSIYHAHYDDYYRYTVAGARYLLEEVAGLCVIYESGGNDVMHTILSLLGFGLDDVDVNLMANLADPVSPLNVYLVAKNMKSKHECETYQGKVKYTSQAIENFRLQKASSRKPISHFMTL